MMTSDRQKIAFGWVLRMAWRDSRRNRSRLFLFISSIIIGIAALVAIFSFGDNLAKDIDKQAAGLVGADLVIHSNRELSEEGQAIVDSVRRRSTDHSVEQRFASMVLFANSGGTRLVEVRALDGAFPYYGAFETVPEGVGATFRKHRQALVDKTLMLQFGAQVGDSVKVGAVMFEIAGSLAQAPGQSGLSTAVAPAVFIPLEYLPATGLNQKGSRINYNYYFQLEEGTDANKLADGLDSLMEVQRMGFDTIASRKQETGRSFADLNNFLSLVGFVALLLGCIGVSSAIHIYIKEKLNTIAILRCLGASSRQAFLIFLVQVLGVGLVGSIIGALLGTLVQQLLPLVLRDFVPVAISSDISWWAIAQGIGLGVCIAALFALLPLVGIRNIAPLNTLRLSVDTSSPIRDRWSWLVYGLIGLFIFSYAYIQLDGLGQTLAFTMGVVLSFLVLYAAASLLVWLVRRFFPSSWSYLWRQGLSNLFRPNNQTVILIIAIGLGTAFIATLFAVQGMLITRVSLSSSENQPNMVLFDIQSPQKTAVADLVAAQGLPVLDQVPIVTVQLEAINGVTADDARRDSTIEVSRRALGGELRSTYRSELSDSEKVTEGEWIGETAAGDTARVSLEEGYARRIRVDIGDELLFNVQGVRIPTIIGSLREVDWNRVQTNFRLIFPTGVIDDAPQFHVLMTRVPDDATSARMQQAVVTQFPNVSIIDLGLILSVLDAILEKIGFVIRFMGGFSILTGFVVLIASVMISKYQRIKESVLLRTMGATRKQILAITALEYFFLGGIAAFTGVLLALGGSWALAVFSFEIPFTPDIAVMLLLMLGVTLLTVLIGLVNSRGITERPPLEILGKEV
ncbi:ABC transporter permease [Parapedobacter sp. 10938]|uniref:ABC transporter permease n=1 Tax=Parapedobacter flavus TaxID=3110225 RepID=UPI002DC008DB|nr:FtsX-like permease family protein [Parapedobacter sp. 10938]MEC3878714.1 FtsX-like permease family protein [Parapedobacter sp. 10938]